MADASTLLTFKDFGLDDFAVVSDHSEQGRNVVGFISSFLQQVRWRLGGFFFFFFFFFVVGLASGCRI